MTYEMICMFVADLIGTDDTRYSNAVDELCDLCDVVNEGT